MCDEIKIDIQHELKSSYTNTPHLPSSQDSAKLPCIRMITPRSPNQAPLSTLHSITYLAKPSSLLGPCQAPDRTNLLYSTFYRWPFLVYGRLAGKIPIGAEEESSTPSRIVNGFPDELEGEGKGRSNERTELSWKGDWRIIEGNLFGFGG